MFALLFHIKKKKKVLGCLIALLVGCVFLLSVITTVVALGQKWSLCDNIITGIKRSYLCILNL